MARLRNISIRARFHLVMGIATVSLLGLGAWGLVDSHRTEATVGDLFDRAVNGSADVGRLREQLASVRRLEAAMVATAVSNTTEVEPLHQQWKKELAALRETGARLSNQQADPKVAELVAAQDKLLADYAAQITPIAQQLAAATMDASAGLAYAQRAAETLDTLQANAGELLKLQQAQTEQLREGIAAGTALSAWMRLGLVGAALAAILPLMFATLRSVCGPLDEAVAVATRIARGDLTSPVHTEGRDEPARLLQAVATMQQALRHLVGQVRHAAESIQIASSEVAGGNLDLSQRTEQAAQHLQGTASAMAELTGRMRQSAESAHDANRLADSATEIAQRGGSVVGQVVSTMAEIHGSSQRIADITATIDGIAFQTNILALNAAVEAARAGEQGRGFAVVAGEVRALAKRAAEAAREIKTLIGASVEKVDAGSRLVGDAGATMGELVGSVRQVREIIGRITEVSGTQSDALAQISGAVAELDRVTQQNAALVEESAAAAESLKAQATTLTGLVATFRIGSGDAASVPAHVHAAAETIARAQVSAASETVLS